MSHSEDGFAKARKTEYQRALHELTELSNRSDEDREKYRGDIAALKSDYSKFDTALAVKKPATIKSMLLKLSVFITLLIISLFMWNQIGLLPEPVITRGTPVAEANAAFNEYTTTYMKMAVAWGLAHCLAAFVSLWTMKEFAQYWDEQVKG